MRQTWIIYKSNDPDAFGWEDRQLLPSGSLTNGKNCGGALLSMKYWKRHTRQYNAKCDRTSLLETR